LPLIKAKQVMHGPPPVELEEEVEPPPALAHAGYASQPVRHSLQLGEGALPAQYESPHTSTQVPSQAQFESEASSTVEDGGPSSVQAAAASREGSAR
jgi:hypothetical protein